MAGDEHGKHKRRAILYRGEIESPQLYTDAMSPFFNYGQGFFETILYENGSLRNFEAHIARIKGTCSAFDIRLDFNNIQEDLIYNYLKEINLTDHCSRVKIIYAPIKDAIRWDTIVTAVPYTRPAGDFTLSIHNEVYDSKLNLYKKINYNYNIYWKNYYKKNEHSDEALFCNTNGNILEGSYSNILFRKKNVLYYVDKSCNYLHGIMQDRILYEAAKIKDLKIQSLKKGIEINQLKDGDEVMICNSLMLIQNVKKILVQRRLIAPQHVIGSPQKKETFTWPSSPGTDYLAPILRKNLL